MATLKKSYSELQVDLNLTKEAKKEIELDFAHVKEQLDEAQLKVQELTAVNKVQERMLAANTGNHNV